MICKFSILHSVKRIICHPEAGKELNPIVFTVLRMTIFLFGNNMAKTKIIQFESINSHTF